MWWTDEMTEYYSRAAERSDFHKNLATLLEPLLDRNRTITELGCGLGYLTAELEGRGYDIKGMDNDEAAIAFARTHFTPSLFIRADAYNPPVKADTAICVFFGRIQEPGNLDALLASAERHLIYVSNEHARGDECSFEKSKAISQLLTQRNIRHSYTVHRLSFDQPLKDEEDARLFISSSYRKDITPTLIKSGMDDFPYLLPKRKAFGIFRIFKEETD